MLLPESFREASMLEGKSILVTGAASGIGRAAAELFARYGARLTLVDRSAAVEEVAAGLPQAQAVAADVAEPEDMARAVAAATERFGGLEGAFNNAGIEQREARMIPIVDYPLDDYDRVMRVNLRGMLVCLKAEIPALIAAGGGSVVNTASVMGWLAQPGMGTYVASKHGVIGLTRTAALEYAAQGVRVNAVLPGAVETPMLTERAFKIYPEYGEMVAKQHPLGRMAQPVEIAEAAAWLLSDKSSFVTGHTLAVDGGYSAV